MVHWISSVRFAPVAALTGLLRAELLGLVPALCLAGLWFGPKGAAVLVIACLPTLLLLSRAPRNPATVTVGEPRDPLTGLHLRSALETRLQSSLAITGKGGHAASCLVICIDDPHELVERYGQSAHDQVMRRSAERLLVMLRDSDLAARLEGSRFGIAFAPTRRADLETLIQLSSRLQAALHEPISVDAMTVYVTFSVGFCMPGRLTDRTGPALLAAAEFANEDAWRNGPSAIRAYSPEVAAAASDRRNLRDQIETALDTGQIVAYFQPQLSTDTGEVTGFEVLARWKHPDRGVLPPAEFLPIITTSGLSGRLGEVMLMHALSALRAWDRAGYRVPSTAVNFSREELRNPKLIDKLRWELDRFELAPARLTIEILETVVTESENDMIIHNIAGLAKIGCGIDLDDFGTGHASITSIRRFAVNRIKIDRSFVCKVDSDPMQQRMVGAILSMAERLDLATLAEGVETLAEHAMLAQLGCAHVQGYIIARPMPFEVTIGWLEAHRRKLAATPKLGRKIG